MDESESSEDGEEVGLKTLSHNFECIVAVGGEFRTLDIHAGWSTAEVEVDLNSRGVPGWDKVEALRDASCLKGHHFGHTSIDNTKRYICTPPL